MDIKENFLKKLQPSGWDKVLKGFIDSPDFHWLILQLQDLHAKGQLTPSVSQVFNAFYECPYNDLKVVILGQDLEMCNLFCTLYYKHIGYGTKNSTHEELQYT